MYYLHNEAFWMRAGQAGSQAGPRSQAPRLESKEETLALAFIVERGQGWGESSYTWARASVVWTSCSCQSRTLDLSINGQEGKREG